MEIVYALPVLVKILERKTRVPYSNLCQKIAPSNLWNNIKHLGMWQKVELISKQKNPDE